MINSRYFYIFCKDLVGNYYTAYGTIAPLSLNALGNTIALKHAFTPITGSGKTLGAVSMTGVPIMDSGYQGFAAAGSIMLNTPNENDQGYEKIAYTLLGALLGTFSPLILQKIIRDQKLEKDVLKPLLRALKTYNIGADEFFDELEELTKNGELYTELKDSINSFYLTKDDFDILMNSLISLYRKNK